jgi:hypothetical protein
MSMIASKRERKRSLCPVSLRSFGRIGPSVCDHAIMTCDSTESSKINLQAFAASNPETLQSQTQSSTENRISINRLNVFHGRQGNALIFCPSFETHVRSRAHAPQDEVRENGCTHRQSSITNTSGRL